jgi:hypothetical protein
MMKNILTITLGFVLLLISNYLGHVHPPFSISWTPILIGLFTGLVLFTTDFRLVIKFSLIIVMIISNDILIKLFAGGTHDWEGVGWIVGLRFVGLIIALIIIVIYGLIKQRDRKKEILLYLFGSCVIIIAYSSYFDSLGLISVNSPTEQIEISKDKGLFISEIYFADKFVIIENDTMTFKHGWIERQTRLNHLGLFKKTEYTDKNNCIIVLDGKFDKYGYNSNIYFKVDDSDANGASPIERTLTFSIDKALNEKTLYFFKQGDWTTFKQIKIKNGL